MDTEISQATRNLPNQNGQSLGHEVVELSMVAIMVMMCTFMLGCMSGQITTMKVQRAKRRMQEMTIEQLKARQQQLQEEYKDLSIDLQNATTLQAAARDEVATLSAQSQELERNLDTITISEAAMREQLTELSAQSTGLHHKLEALQQTEHAAQEEAIALSEQNRLLCELCRSHESDTVYHALNALSLQDSHQQRLQILEAAQIEQARLAQQNLQQQNDDAVQSLKTAELQASKALAAAKENADVEIARLVAINQLTELEIKSTYETTKERERLQKEEIINLEETTRKELETQKKAKVARLHEIEAQHAENLSSMRAKLEYTMVEMQAASVLQMEEQTRKNVSMMQEEERANQAQITKSRCDLEKLFQGLQTLQQQNSLQKSAESAVIMTNLENQKEMATKIMEQQMALVQKETAITQLQLSHEIAMQLSIARQEELIEKQNIASEEMFTMLRQKHERDVKESRQITDENLMSARAQIQELVEMISKQDDLLQGVQEQKTVHENEFHAEAAQLKHKEHAHANSVKYEEFNDPQDAEKWAQYLEENRQAIAAFHQSQKELDNFLKTRTMTYSEIDAAGSPVTTSMVGQKKIQGTLSNVSFEKTILHESVPNAQGISGRTQHMQCDNVIHNMQLCKTDSIEIGCVNLQLCLVKFLHHDARAAHTLIQQNFFLKHEQYTMQYVHRRQKRHSKQLMEEILFPMPCLISFISHAKTLVSVQQRQKIHFHLHILSALLVIKIKTPRMQSTTPHSTEYIAQWTTFLHDVLACRTHPDIPHEIRHCLMLLHSNKVTQEITVEPNLEAMQSHSINFQRQKMYVQYNILIVVQRILCCLTDEAFG